VADAAHAILLRDSKTFSGHFFLDEEVLRAEGMKDFDQYAVSPGRNFMAICLCGSRNEIG